MRSGNHPGFGRVVIETNGKAGYQLDQDGDRVVVRFSEGDMRWAIRLRCRAMSSAIKTDGSGIEVTLKHGTVLQPTAIGGRIRA